jgi:hypothetical protein
LPDRGRRSTAPLDIRTAQLRPDAKSWLSNSRFIVATRSIRNLRATDTRNVTLQDADGGLHQELQYEALVSCRTDGRQLGVMDSETGSVHTQLLGGDGELDGLPQRVRRPSEPATRTSNT